MQAENLHALDTYIENHIGSTTTRHASEERFECPPLVDAVNAERTMRATLHTMYDNHVVLTNEIATSSADDLRAIKAVYWKSAQRADADHGARVNFALDDYFHVSQDRSYTAIRRAVLSQYPADSIPVRMFDALDAYQRELVIDAVSSSRLLTTLFNISLPSIKRVAAQDELKGCSPVNAVKKAIGGFFETTVGCHIADLRARASRGQDIRALINKTSSYPQSTNKEYADSVLRISRMDAEGIAKAYRIQERPYTDEELALGELLIRAPAMQRAILLFHQGLVHFSTRYLERYPERVKHSLEPFSEIFLAESKDDREAVTLIPNPKLIKVISNNVVPAIAKVLINEGVMTKNLTGDHIQRGIELAKKLRIFQTQIGQFNNYNPTTDTVDLIVIFNRTCPAMQMFSEALAKRLPDLYDASRI